MKFLKVKVNKSVIISTSDLDNPDLVKKAFDKLEIRYKPFKRIRKINTNEDSGLLKTNINKKDIEILKQFIVKLPKNYKSLISALNSSLYFNEKKYSLKILKKKKNKNFIFKSEKLSNGQNLNIIIIQSG